MSFNPLVSVIVIFFNTDKYIAEAIESVIDQTYNNWELILVDDGSTDGSTNLALNYVKSYPDQFTYIEHKNHANRGMSASRNLGVKHSKGEYLTFLDSDDTWLPQTLSEQVNIMESHPDVNVVFGKYLNWYSWTANNELAQSDSILPEWDKYNIDTDSVIEPPSLVTSYLKYGYVVKTGTCSIMIKSNTFEKLGGYVDSFTKNFEDHVMFLKICLNERVYISKSCWSKYRRHTESSTKHINSSYDRKFLRILLYSWFEHYLSDRKKKYTEIWDLLQINFKHHVESYLNERLVERNKIKKLEAKLNNLSKDN